MPFEVQVEFSGVDGVKKADVNQAVRNALQAVGLRWRTKFLPKHFTRSGATEYGYAARSPAYMRRKVALARRGLIAGGALPLVFTGELRRQALYGPTDVRATATSTHATVRIPLPRKANLSHPRKAGGSILDELRTTTAREIAELEALLVSTLEFNLRRLGRTSASARGRIGAAPPAAAAA